MHNVSDGDKPHPVSLASSPENRFSVRLFLTATKPHFGNCSFCNQCYPGIRLVAMQHDEPVARRRVGEGHWFIVALHVWTIIPFRQRRPGAMPDIKVAVARPAEDPNMPRAVNTGWNGQTIIGHAVGGSGKVVDPDSGLDHRQLLSLRLDQFHEDICLIAVSSIHRNVVGGSRRGHEVGCGRTAIVEGHRPRHEGEIARVVAGVNPNRWTRYGPPFWIVEPSRHNCRSVRWCNPGPPHGSATLHVAVIRFAGFLARPYVRTIKCHRGSHIGNAVHEIIVGWKHMECQVGNCHDSQIVGG